MPTTRAYEDELMVYLQDPEWAIAYINGAFEEGDPKFILIALENVARARGQTSEFISEKDRQSSEIVLEWRHLLTLLKMLGLGISVKETSQAA